jgi:hypothetical protein
MYAVTPEGMADWKGKRTIPYPLKVLVYVAELAVKPKGT